MKPGARLSSAFMLILVVCFGGIVNKTTGNTLSRDNELRFRENRGQIVDTKGVIRHDIRFVAEVPGVRLYFREDGISYIFAGELATSEHSGIISKYTRKDRDENTTGSGYRLDMTLPGSNRDARIRAEERAPGTFNCFLAQCPEGITGIREYRRLVYENIYDRIDFEILSVNGRVKYNFVVHPGGNVQNIRMKYDGATSTALLNDGNLNVIVPPGLIEEDVPYTYCGDRNHEISSRFSVRGNEVGFDVDNYDQTKDLVIDPWATYLGGSTHWDYAYATATDADGNIYVTGISYSNDFPVTVGAFQTSYAGNSDVFITKYDPNGNIVWSTYYGGSTAGEGGYGCAVDGNGNVIVTGTTGSTDFPVTQGAFQSTHAGGSDMFILKLDASGSRLWSTFYGGSGP